MYAEGQALDKFVIVIKGCLHLEERVMCIVCTSYVRWTLCFSNL